MVASQIGIALHSPRSRGGQVDVAPDRQVEGVESLRMKETDEIDHHDVAKWNRLGFPEGADSPIEAAKTAGGARMKRDKDLIHKAHTFDAVPVCRSLMGSHRVQEVVSTHPNAAWDEPHQFAGEGALSGAAVSGNPDN